MFNAYATLAFIKMELCRHFEKSEWKFHTYKCSDLVLVIKYDNGRVFTVIMTWLMHGTISWMPSDYLQYIYKYIQSSLSILAKLVQHCFSWSYNGMDMTLLIQHMAAGV